MKNWKVLLGIYLASLAGVGILCWYIGKSSVQCKSETIYVPGETIHDTITNNIELVHVEKPNIDTVNLLQYCIDNGLYQFLDYDGFLPGDDPSDYVTPIVVDTLAIISEFITRNEYKVDLFDIDTVGKCSVSPIVQYNKLASISYEFTPIHKQIVTEKIQKFQPFVGIGAGSMSYSAQVGLYTHYGLGVSIQYQRVHAPRTDNDLMVNILYKF